MAKYIVLRFVPVVPMIGVATSDAPGFDEAIDNGNIQVELFDLNINNPEEGSPISIISSNILQHDGNGFFAGPTATATGVFEIGIPSDEYESIDLRVVVHRGADKIVDKKFNYNFEVVDGPLPPAIDAIYKVLKPGGYVFIPPLNTRVGDVLPKDGSPPNFTALKDAIKAVLMAENQGVTDADIAQLDRKESKHIASEIIWDNGNNYPPRPKKKERKLFTLPDADDDDVDEKFAQARDQFEGELQRFYGEKEAKIEIITKYIWALRCSLACEKLTTDADTLQFTFKLHPQETDVNKIRNLSIILKAVNSGSPSTFDTITKVFAEYFYALGVEMPIQIDAEGRFKAALKSEGDVLLEQFKNASDNKIIDIDIDDDIGNTPTAYTPNQITNKYEAIRRLHALNINLNNVPVCEIDTATDIWPLLEQWSTFPFQQMEGFWLNIDALGSGGYDGAEAHADLVICVIAAGEFYLSKELDNQASTVADLEGADIADWKQWYATAEADWNNNTPNPPSALPLDFIPNNLTPAERAEVFAIYIQQFFNITNSVTGFDVPDSSAFQAFGTQGPIENYINQYGLDPSQTATYFPNDPCAQDWLQKKITQLKALTDLTPGNFIDHDNDSTTPDIFAPKDFSTWESLYASGFTSGASIADCTFEQFQQALTGTLAYDQALTIYKKAGGTIVINQLSTLKELISTSCPNIANDPQLVADIIDKLKDRDIYAAKDIVAYSEVDFVAIVVDVNPAHSTIKECAENIYQLVRNPTGPTLEELISNGCPGIANDPQLIADIIDQLKDKDIYAAKDIVAYSEIDFVAIVVDVKPNHATIKDCAKSIHQTAVDASLSVDPVDPIIFQPVNPNNTLINCIPSPELNPYGPIAYLQDLIKLNTHSTCEVPFRPAGSGVNIMDAIKERRGNLGELQASLTNLKTCIPYIDIYNERLEALVVDGVAGSSTVIPIFNNSIETALGHQLAVEGITDSADGFYHDPQTFFEAIPEYFSAAAGDILKDDFSAPGLPYDPKVDRLETYLSCLGKDRYQLMRSFRRSIHEFALDPRQLKFDLNPSIPYRDYMSRYPVNFDLSLAYLGFTENEYKFLFASTVFSGGKAAEILGYTTAQVAAFDFDWETDAKQLKVFLERTGLEYCELRSLQLALKGWSYVNFDIKNDDDVIVNLPACEPCHLHPFRLEFSPPTQGLYRVLLFIRLWQKQKDCFSMIQLREICEGLGLFPSGNIHIYLIRKLAAFKMLHRIFGLPLNNGTDDQYNNIGSTHMLALWQDHAWVNNSTENRALRDWARAQFIDHIQQYAIQKYGSAYRPAPFLELLIKNLDALAPVVGFGHDPNQVWNDCPFRTIRFADFIAKYLASDFSFGEFIWLFSNWGIAGDDPFPLQSANEACCFPLDTPDNETDFSLKVLREKLCAIEVSEEEIESWNWQRIENVFAEKFCTGTQSKALLDFAEKFLPNLLSAQGHHVPAPNRQFRVSVNSIASLWNTTDPDSPIRYDAVSNELWSEIPMDQNKIYEKISRIRKLNNGVGTDEQQAVLDLVYAPLVKLAPLAMIFDDFSQAKKYLIEEANEDNRWEFFRAAFALFYKRSECIVAFIAAFANAITCQENEEGEAIAWKIMCSLFADENLPVGGQVWENADGSMPDLVWENSPSAGAFASILGILGMGLKCEFYDLDGIIKWRGVTPNTDFFGAAQNKWNAPVSMVVPSIGYSDTTNYVSIRNGFAIDSSNGKMLGGAEGFSVQCEGELLIEEGGQYTFMAGQSTAEGEAPFFEEQMIQQWCVSIKKGQKEWELLSHNWEEVDGPSHTSVPVKLKRGAYTLCIAFIQPAPNFDEANKVCPQFTGFQLKYNGADTNDLISIIPLKQLFMGEKDASFAEGINISGAPLDYLKGFYPVTLPDSRNTFHRIMKSMVLAYRFCWSAKMDGDDGSCEIEFLLNNSDCFRGYSYNWDYTLGRFIEHQVPLNINLLPVPRNYCAGDNSRDNRNFPSLERRRAFSDLFELMFDYKYIKEKSKSAPEPTAWKFIKENLEGHPDSKMHLLRHLGAPINLAEVATHLYPSVVVSDNDLKDINWLLRICLNVSCLEEMSCAFNFKDITAIQPDTWVTSENNLLQGIENLMQTVRDSLIEQGAPRKYNTLKLLNDGLRIRYRDAMLNYLTGVDRVKVNDNAITDSKGISQYILMNIDAGICQKMSRVEEAISAVQLYVNQAKLGLESKLDPSSSFNQLWRKRMGSYKAWKQCAQRTLYYENYFEFEELESARKSPAFQFLEKRLEDQTLTIPVSGRTAVLTSPKPPPHQQISILQKRESSLINIADPVAQGVTIYGQPDTPSSTWLSSETTALPYWLSLAIQLDIPVLCVTASGLPAAGITYDCEHNGCCSECGEIHDPCVDQYYFWHMDAQYFEAIEQEADWYEDTANEFADLIFMKPHPEVYLCSVKKHNHQFSSPNKSSESIQLATNPQSATRLEFKGRIGDILELTVNNAEDSSDSFWFNLVNQNTSVLPQTGLKTPEPNGPKLAGSNLMFPANPYFIYYKPGAPNFPKSNFSAVVAVAENLKRHCQFEDGLKWIEKELQPLLEDNSWDQERKMGNFFANRTLLLHYIEILNYWGKALMQDGSGEKIQQASVVFNLAKKILGDCPKTIYENQNIDNIQTIDQYEAAAAPINPTLLCLFEEVENNCALIEACVRAERQSSCGEKSSFWGAEHSDCTTNDKNCFQDLYQCLPESPYGYRFLQSKAQELANQLSGLGGSLLSALEKCDAETISNLREIHGKQILDLSLSIKEKLARESNWNRQSVEVSLELAYNRLAYHQNLIANGLISEEEDNLDFTNQSMVTSAISQGINAIIGPIELVPDLHVGPFPLVSTTGGKKIANSILAGARVVGVISSIQSMLAGKRATQGSQARRLQQWQQTVQEILLEIKNLKRQLRATDLREKVALQEANNHLLQTKQTEEILAFLQEKFTSKSLYYWMKTELTGLYYQFYQCALKVALQAEMAYNKECGFTNEKFIHFTPWDNLHKGLLSGEKIQLALRRMEEAYLNKDVREYELMKNISLRKHAPREFLKLKATGKCIVHLPEWLFDKDYPGQYRRRIVCVKVTVPCVVGPYESVNCKMTLVKSSIRQKPTLACKITNCCEDDPVSNYSEHPEDHRFVYRYLAKEAMATSTAQNDSGIRQLNFNDERYLLFECEGAISTWCIELPQENNQFDVCTVSDFILHVDYDAKEGGKLLAAAAHQAAQKHLPGDGWKLFDVPNEFPDHWYQFESAWKEQQTPNELLIQLGRKHFPFVPGKNDLSVDRLEIFFEACETLECSHYDVQLLFNPKDRDEHPDKCELVTVKCVLREDFGCMYHGILDFEKMAIPDKGSIDMALLIFPNPIDCISKMYWIMGYDAVSKKTGCGKELNSNRIDKQRYRKINNPLTS